MDPLIKLDMSHFKAVTANLTAGGETCNLASAGTETELAPFVRKVEAASILEIDRLMAELQELKNHLQSERKRIERETVRYRNLTKTASASVNTIFDAVSQLYPTLYRPKSSASKVTTASREATTGAPKKAISTPDLPTRPNTDRLMPLTERTLSSRLAVDAAP